MSFAGQTNFVSANTYFQGAAADLFARPQAGFWETFTAKFPMNGQQLGLETFGPGGSMAELVGNRRWGGLREYLKQIPVKVYSTDPSLEIPSKAALGDITGALKSQIDMFMSPAAWAWDKFATEVITGNATGIDGVALLHNSHPYGSGGATWDNLTTDALGFASFNAGIVAMESLLGENGEPLNISPTHLMVGPGLSRTALEVVGAVRPFAMNASGVEAATSVLATTGIGNVLAGRVEVIVNRRLSSTEWYLMDLGKEAKPVAMGELEALHGVAVTSPDSSGMVDRSVYRYFIEGKAGFGGWWPQTIYGSEG